MTSWVNGQYKPSGGPTNTLKVENLINSVENSINNINTISSQINSFKDLLNNKINSDKVYTKEQCDNKYLTQHQNISHLLEKSSIKEFTESEINTLFNENFI